MFKWILRIGVKSVHFKKTVARISFLSIQNKTKGTVNSRFKKLHFSFLKSSVVWFKKDFWYESKIRSSEKKSLCRWICKLRSFLNQEFTVLRRNCLTYWDLPQFWKKMNLMATEIEKNTGFLINNLSRILLKLIEHY